MKSADIYRILAATLAFSGAALLADRASVAVGEGAVKYQIDILPQQAVAQQGTVYVNPQSGADSAGAGQSQGSAFRTIGYALQQANSGTVIQLAPGQYTSETFPIQLKAGVTLKGNEGQKGQGVEIVGGGDYRSPVFSMQNVTVVAAPNSQIIGVTITNRNTRGTGIWVEDSNPAIRESTFVSNNREGVFVAGSAAPRIEKNIFRNNTGNGIAVAGQAQGEIRENSFENTGFGLAIGGTSTVLVENNQIRGNRSGVVVTQKARPVLRGNTIENNTDYGIVSLGQAQPDMGNNTFASNGKERETVSVAQGTPANPRAPYFSCLKAEGSSFATVAFRENNTSPQPLVNWSRAIETSGETFTPERRCQEVTERLNNMIVAKGIASWADLKFTVGTVNSAAVVCLVSGSETCSNNNMLLTLTGDNAKNPQKALEAVLSFGSASATSGSPLLESSDDGEEASVSLAELEQKLQPDPALWFVGGSGQ
ncbi:MAG: DUF1565 domain-containing protein [Oscillatoria princeps RMCB-10]|jgi:parallel beta-helix repeat protein|nr:DUF1565 domain-containing protein [Oscillatoria princeps RMCB-10]